MAQRLRMVLLTWFAVWIGLICTGGVSHAATVQIVADENAPHWHADHVVPDDHAVWEQVEDDVEAGEAAPSELSSDGSLVMSVPGSVWLVVAGVFEATPSTGPPVGSACGYGSRDDGKTWQARGPPFAVPDAAGQRARA